MKHLSKKIQELYEPNSPERRAEIVTLVQKMAQEDIKPDSDFLLFICTPDGEGSIDCTVRAALSQESTASLLAEITMMASPEAKRSAVNIIKDRRAQERATGMYNSDRCEHDDHPMPILAIGRNIIH